MIMLINSIAIIRMSTITLQSWLDAIKNKGYISFTFAKMVMVHRILSILYFKL